MGALAPRTTNSGFDLQRSLVRLYYRLKAPWGHRGAPARSDQRRTRPNMATILRTSFDKGPERWCSYDYHMSVLGRSNIFILTTHETSGGVNGSGYVWADGV